MTTWKRIRKIAVWGVFLSILCYALWFTTRVAQQDDNWKTGYQRLPEVHLSGDTLIIEGMRDFRYDENGNVAVARYIDRHYVLSQLQRVWFGLSHFGDYGLAHAFASFEFSDGQFLAVSIEARLREDQNEYSPLAGALREYTKFVVLASEEDVIGLRSFVRQEPLYLYSLNGSALQGQALLLNFLRRADNLRHTPDFYNTLTDNCLTGLLAESGRYNDLHHWLDYRILLPGYADEVLFEHQLIGQGEPLEEIRAGARINTSVSPDTHNYSILIRQ